MACVWITTPLLRPLSFTLSCEGLCMYFLALFAPIKLHRTESCFDKCRSACRFKILQDITDVTVKSIILVQISVLYYRIQLECVAFGFRLHKYSHLLKIISPRHSPWRRTRRVNIHLCPVGNSASDADRWSTSHSGDFNPGKEMR
jgi:hypothetical protein